MDYYKSIIVYTNSHERGGDAMDQVLLRIPEVCAALGLSRTVVFDLLRRGELNSVRIGRARRVPTAALQDYVRRLLGEQSAGA